MAYPRAVMQALRQSYIDGLPLTAAAILHKVPYPTARGWKKRALAEADDWDKIITALKMGAGGDMDTLSMQLVTSIAKNMFETSQELESSHLPAQDKVALIAQINDAFAKFSKSMRTINPALNELSIALEVLQIIKKELIQDETLRDAFLLALDDIAIVIGQRFGN